MALHWSIEDVEDYDAHCRVPAYDDDGNIKTCPETGEELTTLSPITQTLIWATMTLGMRGITKKNVDDVYKRYRLAHALGCIGGIMERNASGKWDDRRLTYNEIRNHIGLQTNAAPLTWSAFHKRMTERFYEDVENYSIAPMKL